MCWLQYYQENEAIKYIFPILTHCIACNKYDFYYIYVDIVENFLTNLFPLENFLYYKEKNDSTIMSKIKFYD